jgi:hypothetical protein
MGNRVKVVGALDGDSDEVNDAGERDEPHCGLVCDRRLWCGLGNAIR